MTTIKEGAKYLRVKHTGQSKGSLYLSDLDGESNKTLGRQIQVYIPENGQADLPLNDQVLLSYQQGSIAGFTDQGLLTATVVEDEAGAEVWVSPDGDDTNPGTRSAPFASIAHAVDRVQSDHPFMTTKRVTVLPGSYNEPTIHINHPYLELVGLFADSYGYSVSVSNPDNSAPVLAITTLTDQGYASFEQEGGVSYVDDGSSFVYDGANVTGRDVQPFFDSAFNFMHVSVKGIKIPTDGTRVSPDVIVLGAPHGSLSSDEAGICFANLSDLEGNFLYLKNALQSKLYSAYGRNETVFDNCSSCMIGVSESTGRTGMGSLIARADDTVKSTEGVVSGFKAPVALIDARVELADPIRLYGSGFTGDFPKYNTLSAYFTRSDGFEIMSPANVQCRDLECGYLVKSGNGTLKINRIDCTGNVTISAGTSNVIKGGVIEGNLTVNTPASVDLTNVVVKGDVNGDGDVVMNGGGYLGANNLTGAYTHTPIKTA